MPYPLRPIFRREGGRVPPPSHKSRTVDCLNSSCVRALARRGGGKAYGETGRHASSARWRYGVGHFPKARTVFAPTFHPRLPMPPSRSEPPITDPLRPLAHIRGEKVTVFEPRRWCRNGYRGAWGRGCGAGVGGGVGRQAWQGRLIGITPTGPKISVRL